MNLKFASLCAMLLGGASAQNLRRELGTQPGGVAELRDGADTVLFLGDSWSDWAGEILEESQNCGNVNVVNKAIGGTTAAQWAVGGSANLNFNGQLIPVPVDVESAFKQAEEETNVPVSRVWLSIGGNDILGTATCTVDIDVLKENVAKTLDKIAEVDDSVEVLITGYSALSRFPYAACTSNTDIEVVNTQVLEFAADYSDLDVTAVNVWDLMKTKDSGDNSDVKFYQDNDSIHLNGGGYKRLFAQADINEFMCQNTESDTLLVVGLIGGVAAVFAVIVVLMFKK